MSFTNMKTCHRVYEQEEALLRQQVTIYSVYVSKVGIDNTGRDLLSDCDNELNFYFLQFIVHFERAPEHPQTTFNI